MTCDTIEARLIEYLEGTLDEAVRLEMDRHLETCAHCRAEADELRPTLALLQSGLASRKRQAPKLDPSHRSQLFKSAKVGRGVPVAPVRGKAKSGIVWWVKWQPILNVAAAVALLFVMVAVFAPALSSSRHSAKYVSMEVGANQSAPQKRFLSGFKVAEQRQTDADADGLPESELMFGTKVAADSLSQSVNEEFGRPSPSSSPSPSESPMVASSHSSYRAGADENGQGIGGGVAADKFEVTMAKSPLIMRGLNSSRTSGGRAAAVRDAGEGGAGQGAKDAGDLTVSVEPAVGKSIVAGMSDMGGDRVSATPVQTPGLSGGVGFTDLKQERFGGEAKPERKAKASKIRLRDKEDDTEVVTPQETTPRFAYALEGRAQSLPSAKGAFKKNQDKKSVPAKPESVSEALRDGRSDAPMDVFYEASVSPQSGKPSVPAPAIMASLAMGRMELNETVANGPVGQNAKEEKALKLDVDRIVLAKQLESESSRRVVDESKVEVAEATPVYAEPPPVYNQEIITASNAFSTFAIDVDTASFTRSRKFLLAGTLPSPGSVRVEEFINAFEYAYPSPERRAFSVHTDRVRSPFRSNQELLRVGVRGKVIGRDRQRFSVLTLVIDTSGSMNTPDRLDLIKASLRLLVANMSPADRLSIVTFGSEARLVLDAVPLSQTNLIVDTVNRIQATGSTQLEGGMKLGYETAVRHFRSGAVNRVLLLSDGVANLGAGTAAEILDQVAAARQQGVYCSVFGFGQGPYNDAMLETLADKGDGVYRFVDSLTEARRVFVEDLAANLHVIARDVKIQVEFNPSRVKTYRQVGYENRALTKEQFRDDKVDAGEVGSGQSVTALYEVGLHGNPMDPLGTVRLRWKDAETGHIEEVEHSLRASEQYGTFDQAPVRFRLAAGVAEFADHLRNNPVVMGTELSEVARVIRAVGLELNLDQRVADLVRMVAAAEKLMK